MSLVGDRERERAADQLRRHYLDGRLTVDELATRLHAALRARSRGELAAALGGLPRRWEADGALPVVEAAAAVARRGLLAVLKLLVWLVGSLVLLVAFAAWLGVHGPDLGALLGFPLVWLALTWLLWFSGPSRRAGRRS